MGDSTAVVVIDATSWTYIDSTSDSTGITNVQVATANTLVNEFSNSNEITKKKSAAISSSLDNIKGLISAIPSGSYTPAALMDSVTSQALNASFSSTAWLSGEDTLQNIQDVQGQCTVLKDIAKFVDPSSMTDSMKSGVFKDAENAISRVLDSFKFDFPSLSLPEFGIAKQLSDLINTGRTSIDQTKKAFSGTVSSILEHGKAGLGIAESAIDKSSSAISGAVSIASGGIASLTKGLKVLDGLTDCVNGLGGAAFATQADEMIDATNDIFDSLSVESDPNSPNYGEFDEQAYMDSIGGLTAEQKSNILKCTNVYNQSANNAGTAVDKVATGIKPVSDKSVSSLKGSAKQIKPEENVNYIQAETPVTVEIPPIPAKQAIPATATTPYQPPVKAQPAKTITSPVPVPTAAISTAAPAVPKPKIVLFSNLFGKIFINDFTVDNDRLVAYSDYDPNGLFLPEYRQQLMRWMIQGGVEEQYVGIKTVNGVMNINWLTEDQSSISSSVSYEYSVGINFFWGLADKPVDEITYDELILDPRLASPLLVEGQGWTDALANKRGGGNDKVRAQEVRNAVLDAIALISFRGGGVDVLEPVLARQFRIN